MAQTAPHDGLARRQVVQVAAEQLRVRIFARPAGEQIGSLPELARDLGVGIVTVQQAARILEHEGLLEVRRGPGGGYYGRRPDRSDLERVLGAYMRSDPASWKEVLDITSLLFNRLCASAARCGDPAHHAALRDVARRIAACDDEAGLAELETALQDALFAMVERPLFELLTHVALGFARTPQSHETMFAAFGLDAWKEGRRRIIDAILRRDPELAHFEADRQNRQKLVEACGLADY